MDSIKNKKIILISSTIVCCIFVLITSFLLSNSIKSTEAASVICPSGYYASKNDSNYCCNSSNLNVYHIDGKHYCSQYVVEKYKTLVICAQQHTIELKDGYLNLNSETGFSDDVCTKALGLNYWSPVNSAVGNVSGKNVTLRCGANIDVVSCTSTAKQADYIATFRYQDNTLFKETSCSPNSATSNCTVTMNSTPTKNNQNFIGWSSSSNCSNPSKSTTFTLSKNTTYYACFAPPDKDITITFKNDGITYGTDTCTIKSGEEYCTILVPTPAPQKSGYTFLGWDKSSNCDSANKWVQAFYGTQTTNYYACFENATINCSAGQYYEGNGKCTTCPANHYCPGGSFSTPGGKTACPTNTTAVAGSNDASDCKTQETPGSGSSSSTSITCSAGQYYEGNEKCTTCPANHYCPGGSFTTPGGKTACPDEKISKAGSDNESDCKIPKTVTCPAGQYHKGNKKCITCPKNYYCPGGNFILPGGINNCPSGKTSPAGSDNISDCKNTGSSSSPNTTICVSGKYYEGNGKCTTCPANHYCPGGSFTTPGGMNACPNGTLSASGSDSVSDCKTQDKPNSGSSGQGGMSCPAGQYNKGDGNCTVCP